MTTGAPTTTADGTCEQPVLSAPGEQQDMMGCWGARAACPYLAATRCAPACGGDVFLPAIRWPCQKANAQQTMTPGHELYKDSILGTSRSCAMSPLLSNTQSQSHFWTLHLYPGFIYSARKHTFSSDFLNCTIINTNLQDDGLQILSMLYFQHLFCYPLRTSTIADTLPTCLTYCL